MHNLRSIRPVVGLVLFCWLTPSEATAQTKLLRFPDIHDDQVVFTYAGDLWLAGTSGGTATRLTAHPGIEVFAKFSPDGQYIAFTGQYDGDEQVYVVPTAGGSPRQLTFYPAAGPLPPRWGYDNQVYGWTPDGTSVLFRSLRDGWDVGDSQLFTVSLNGGLPTALPMPESGAGDFSPRGDQVVYSPLVRDFRHWKRYEGGWAQELYIFDLATHAATPVTDHPRADRDPMWIDDTIVFTSDRDGKNNLFVYDTTGGGVTNTATTQLTHYREWDVRWPSADHARGRIVYELDGELQVLDLSTGDSQSIVIRVPDDGVSKRPSRVSVAGRVADIGLSPRGERAVLSARGDIFTVPVERGPTRNLTRTSGAHDREPAWSPDGRQIAFVSDQNGEEEIWLVDQDGKSPPRQLTDGHRGRLHDLAWSPDGERIAYRDHGLRLYLADVDSGRHRQIADDPAVFGLSFAWSPHGGHLAFSLGHANGNRSLYLWSAIDDQVRQLTDEIFSESSPTWGPNGDYLFYLSTREWSPQLGSFEFDYVLDREVLVYALALRDDVAHPFPPRSDEATIDVEPTDKDKEADGKSQGKDSNGGKNDDAPETSSTEDNKPIRIDFDGLAQRVARVPLAADNYIALSAVEGHLLAFRVGAAYYGRQSDVSPGIRVFAYDSREDSMLIEDLRAAAFSADGKKLLVDQQGSLKLIDTKAKGADGGKVLNLGGLAVDLVPDEQWRQIFHEVWRRFRDFFYVENMHGYDWEALRRQYEPWLEHVAHRSDLNYVISEMIGELSASHTYVSGGDFEAPRRPDAALLGARFELDTAAGRYRISKIFDGDNAEDAYRSPLTEVGVNASVGDTLLRINGREVGSNDNPYELLRHAGGGPVEVTLSSETSSATSSEPRTVLVQPIRSEDNLIYLEWIRRNQHRVAEASGGRLGYIHIPNMGASGIREWIKWFYGQQRKDGLVIDVRSNGGGNVSPMIIERLRRELLMVDFGRNQDFSSSYPRVMFAGHLACLVDEDTASDGDQFAWVFKQAGLGPLVGKRSWGGVVGYFNRGPLIDGGSVSVAESGTAGPDGQWVIEGYGVEPDVEVENPPAALLAGRDPQLEKAVELLLAKLRTEPVGIPQTAPPSPVKTQHGSRQGTVPR